MSYPVTVLFIWFCLPCHDPSFYIFSRPSIARGCSTARRGSPIHCRPSLMQCLPTHSRLVCNDRSFLSFGNSPLLGFDLGRRAAAMLGSCSIVLCSWRGYSMQSYRVRNAHVSNYLVVFSLPCKGRCGRG